MLISLTMSSAREHPPKDCVGSLAQLDIARFVFYNYTWELDNPDYSTYNGHLIPARIPLTAIISGTFSFLLAGIYLRPAKAPWSEEKWPRAT